MILYVTTPICLKILYPLMILLLHEHTTRDHWSLVKSFKIYVDLIKMKDCYLSKRRKKTVKQHNIISNENEPKNFRDGIFPYICLSDAWDHINEWDCINIIVNEIKRLHKCEAIFCVRVGGKYCARKVWLYYRQMAEI